ncbi:MAG: NAD(P)/FAD-dependent oxidoreductase [Deltaproteobacteria bacterium]|nr:NAD(P)/FAD-dependent oxidoreductase [Deltaproteobacteria bacterium]
MGSQPKNGVVGGGGTGGTLAANLLSRKLNGSAQVTLVDPSGRHVYQPGFLYLMLGQLQAQALSRPERQLLRSDVRLLVDGAERIDPDARTVALASGETLAYDALVLAAGARLSTDEIPGFDQGVDHFYSADAATRLWERLQAFHGGTLVVGVGGVPFKCPVAPLEALFLVDDYLRRRGLRGKTELHYVTPMPHIFHLEAVTPMLEELVRDRGVIVHDLFNLDSVNHDERVLVSYEGEEVRYDLAILVPPHKGSLLAERSGLADRGGWLKTARTTLEVEATERIWALGDATNLPVSKAGSVAHAQAPVVAERVSAALEEREPTGKHQAFGGDTLCFIEVGQHKATLLRFSYTKPPSAPRPNRLFHYGKLAFNRLYFPLVPQGYV